MKKEKHILVETILDLLDVKSSDLSELSSVVQIAMAKLILTYRGEHTGIETDNNGFPYPFERYLDEANIPYTSYLIKEALKKIEEYKLIKNNKLNLQGDDDIESPITWALWANLIDGVMEQEIKEDGKRYYKLTSKGNEKVENMLKK